MSEANRPTDTLDRFARRASLVFAGFVLLDVIVGVVSLASDRPVAERVLALVGPVAWSVLAVVLISGLGRRTSATSASIIVLWGLIVAGAIETLVAFGQGRLYFPIGLVLAAVVLRSLPAGLRVWSGDRAARLGATIAGVVVAFVIAWPLALGALLKPGASPLSVGPDALEVGLEVDCAPPVSGEPVAGTAHVAWAWHSSDLFGDGPDRLDVTWHGTTYFILGGYEAEAAGAGLLEADRGVGTVTFEVDTRGTADGALDLDLLGDVQTHGELIVRVTYAHLDRWTKRSDGVTCAW